MYVETSIREVDVLLVDLEISLLNLQLPTKKSRDLFANEVRVVDLLDKSLSDPADLNTVVTSWNVAESKICTRDSLNIWAKFLQSARYLKHAEFHVVDAKFTDAQRQKLVAEVGFSALAKTDVGLQHASAKLALSFQRSSSSTDNWRCLLYTSDAADE